MAVAGDMAFPGVEGRRTPKTRILNAYIGRLHATAATDADVATAFFRVAGLLDPPSALLAPRIALRVLRLGRGTPQTVSANPRAATVRR
jgi:hypothetical protein